MTDEDIALVRESFAHLHRRKNETAEIFYARLFKIAPEVRPMFKGDSAAQRTKLMETLTVAIATLRDPKGFGALLGKLGRNHHGYGVQERHFDDVGKALIWTLRTSLGPAFTPELERAWLSLYDEMASIMIAAGRAA
ncbi:globin domain-containing protein [Bosea sp. 124]|uniref:globin domain-containing protein n=1 Tax=Bosea sp. 124 TaxID=2135642 RepID=UPI000D484234|nr:globin domain-containing protein [Bosea sp. 124]PTM38832.1 hemoglobin-like flavoprotein [Bosea sp. 124]